MQTPIGAAKYGMALQQSIGQDVSAAANGAMTTVASHGSGHSVGNPMIWLLGIGAVTLGLVSFSTHVGDGKISASAKIGG